MQEKGHEFGVTTGRRRRCGWLDIPLLKYTSMVNGYSDVALTKLDILDELDEIQIGVTYVKDGTPLEHFPSCEQVSNDTLKQGRRVRICIILPFVLNISLHYSFCDSNS